MPRPKSQVVDVEKLQALAVSLDEVVDYRPIISYTMKQCGATSREIAEVFGVSRQMAEYYVEQIEKAIR